MRRDLFGEEETMNFGSLTADRKSKELLDAYIQKRIKEARSLDSQVEENKKLIFHQEETKKHLTTEVDNIRKKKDEAEIDLQHYKDENEAYHLINQMEAEKLVSTVTRASNVMDQAERESKEAIRARKFAEKSADLQNILTCGHKVTREYLIGMVNDIKYYKVEAKQRFDNASKMLDDTGDILRVAEQLRDDIDKENREQTIKNQELSEREAKIKADEEHIKDQKDTLTLERAELRKQARTKKLNEYRRDS